MNRPKPLGELRRFRLAASVTLVLCGLIFALILLYGNSPRPTVDRLNSLLGLLAAIAFGVLVHAFWRLRQACTVHRDEPQS